MQNADELKRNVINFVRQNGPVLPAQISKIIGKDTMYAGAILSSLVASRNILITNVKIGGSPFYYIHGQEYKLQNLSKHLRDREQEAYEILKNKKVLRDLEALPVYRVALREIKDFAVQITVKNQDKEEIFWKWYLLPDYEAKNIINNLIEPSKIQLQTVKEEKQELIKPEITRSAEIRKELYKRIEKEIQKPKLKETKDQFQYIIDNFIKSNQIKILNYEVVRKDKEINIIIELPTGIGNLKFFVKAKNKKSISNADLSLAYNEAQQKNIPILFLTTGKPTKKYQEFIIKNLKNQLIFKQIN